MTVYYSLSQVNVSILFLLNFFTNAHTCKSMLRKRLKSMQGKNCLFPSFTTSLCSEKLTGTKVNFLRGFIIKNSDIFNPFGILNIIIRGLFKSFAMQNPRNFFILGSVLKPEVIKETFQYIISGLFRFTK